MKVIRCVPCYRDVVAINKMVKKIYLNQGQSLIEVVFAIGLILLVVSGIVSLMLSTLGARTKGYDRLKAVELSQIVMESVVNEKTTDPSSFWNLQSIFWTTNMGTTQTNTNYPNYNYSMVANPRNDLGCNNTATVVNCIDVVVNVGWSGSSNVEIYNRFFSNK